MDDRTKIPDPQGMISRIRARMAPNCAVRKSIFCDYVIAMRMQGISYRDIEDWLIDQGKQHRISAPTIWRNFERTKMDVELPLAEEIKERWGGTHDLNLARELSNAILLQRQRVDHMMRQEAQVQKTNPRYSNKLIRAELETLNGLIAQLNKMTGSPLEAAEQRAKADQIRKGESPDVRALTPDTEALLTDLILNDGLRVDHGNDTDPKTVQ